MTLADSILATLAYHDIFDYPLTLNQVQQYLTKQKTTADHIEKTTRGLAKSGKIGAKNGYFYLRSRSKITATRKQRSLWSKKKLKRAAFFAQILKIIPTLKLVAVSGALAMENSHKDDDIDLVLVTAKNALWTTRFLANLLLLPFKRDPNGRKIADRACLNIFIDESDLKISPQNLYLAHEIAQMKPLWDRDGTYARFIKANGWVKKYFPNWQPQAVNSKSKIVNRKSLIIHLPFTILYSPVETFFKKFQLLYMHSKVTTEKIGKTQLFFHPTNTQKMVLAEYQRRLKKLKIL